jgi:hypothetical protein
MTTCENTAEMSPEQITRVKLLGMGIVCGLEVFRDTQCYISITKGVGITSAGHVICLSDKKIKYYKSYNDPNGYFKKMAKADGETEQSDCALYELLEHREEGAQSIVPQNISEIDRPFLEGKVVLVYLEDAQKMVVKLLLIDEQCLWRMLKANCLLHTHCIPTEPIEDEDLSIFSNRNERHMQPDDEDLYNAVHKKYMLNKLVMRRFGYGAVDIGDLALGDSHSENLEPDFDFTHPTDAAIRRAKFFKAYELIIDDALKALDDGIDNLHNYFGCMIDPCHCQENDHEVVHHSPCNPVNSDFETATGLQMHNVKIWKQYFTNINIKWALYKKLRQPVESIQYFYNFVKDLVDTYNELLDELYELVNYCCTGTECFPMHLMLGRIQEEVSFQPSIFRQAYEQPPVYNGNANRLQQIRFLHWRMTVMMKCFFIPDFELDDFSDESYYDVLAIEGEKKLGIEDSKLPLRITPSRLFSEVLGKQAIPFYYNLSNSPYSLQYYWDYFSTKHNREDHQLSFFAKELPGYSNLDFVKHPFLFSLVQYPFYRIEGHTKMNANEAVAQIKALRKRYSLSFDVRAIALNELKELFSDSDAAFGFEHVGGVQKGFTFLLVHDGKENQSGTVVADFQLPFMGGFAMQKATTPTEDRAAVMKAAWEAILRSIGAPKRQVDDFNKIGIDARLQELYVKNGINSYAQLGKLKAADIAVLEYVFKIEGKGLIKEESFVLAANNLPKDPVKPVLPVKDKPPVKKPGSPKKNK